MVNLENLHTKMAIRHCLPMALILCFSISNASAQEEAEQLRRPFWMQGQQMRKAFADIAKTPQSWTVKFFSGTEAVAYGAIVSDDGWIVTKGSQIQKATLCELPDGKRLPFEYVGFDITLDLGL
ncbi:hypothetical protein N9153_03680, partial [Planctomicrobium sp.]|nr:hypothetical protein [Planctomicrobium sp.]